MWSQVKHRSSKRPSCGFFKSIYILNEPLTVRKVPLRSQTHFLQHSISSHLNLSSFVSDGILRLPDVLLQCVFLPNKTQRDKEQDFLEKSGGKSRLLHQQTASQKVKTKEPRERKREKRFTWACPSEWKQVCCGSMNSEWWEQKIS